MSASALLVEPAYRAEPEYAYTLGDEVADLADLAGFAPDPEQRLALDVSFGVGHDGRSCAFEFCVVCCRQNLKTGLFKQAALGWLFITDQQLIVWSAHEFNTAKEAHRDLANLIDGCAYLSRHVKQIYRGSGAESIELMSGQRVIFKARTKSGGRGLTGDKVVLDEAFALRPDHMGALLPTLSVRPDPQVVYGSSAGLADSDVLRGVRDRGRARLSPRLGYLEWCSRRLCEDDRCEHALGVPGCALDDPEAWGEGNPLLGRTRANGTGLTVEYVAAERQAQVPAEFARERLGWWDEPGADAVFGPGKWDACFGERPADLEPAALALAVSFDLTRAAVGAASKRGDVVYVKPLRHGPGIEWTVEAVRDLQERHDVPVVVDGKGPAAVLIPALQQAGIRLTTYDTATVQDSCALIFDLVQTGRLRHESYPELTAAVAGAAKRPVGDRWAWGRRHSAADISTLEAVTLAAWQASQVPEVEVWGFRL